MRKNMGGEKSFIMPGEKIAVVEEFFSGHGTYEEGGTIFSEFVGYISKDLNKRVVSVNPCTRTPIVPREGAKIIGFITHTMDKMAFIDITIIDGEQVPTPFTAMLHISNSSPRYERYMNDVCKIGDVLKAKIINVKNRVPQLETIDADLGVVQAFCSQCGGPLTLVNRVLKCGSCGSIERRKTSSEYYPREESKR